MNKITINGVDICPFSSREELMDYVDENKSILVAINAEKVMNATDQTRAIINGNTGYCDGVGAVWALKQKGAKNAVKIPGCELWLNIVNRYHDCKSFYLVGGKQEVIDATIAKLKEEYPKINILGYRNGYLKSEEERQALIDDVVNKKPDVVFVAMGSPKQELLMGEMQQRHKAIYQGLGGSFDVYTGNADRAPKWWLDHNLEFAYRFFKNPKRIKRQVPIIKLAIKLLFHKV
ncbi:MAG: WecB/TagA/CpsF family glycosyltransferase [Muribaculaceae bacterium]|nr:WecB/TagA/CpsF family glycosyltransferase [Muribaculaceae bacterium]